MKQTILKGGRYRRTVTRATEVLEIVQTEVLGPNAKESPENFKYAIDFVDGFSWCEAYLFILKTQVDEQLDTKEK